VRLVTIALAVGLAVVGSVALAGTAAAQTTSCTPPADASLTAVFSADGATATFTVVGDEPLCSPVDIGLAVYLKDGPDFVVPQTLFDSATGTLTSGTTTLSVTLPTEGVDPHCFTQSDAFTGAVLPSITATQRYNERLLAYLYSTVPACVAGESTSTSSTTTTTKPPASTAPTTTAPRTPTTPTSSPITVEAASITAANPPAGAALARTGSAVDIDPLVAGAGALLCLGGACVAWANRPRLHAG